MPKCIYFHWFIWGRIGDKKKNVQSAAYQAQIQRYHSWNREVKNLNKNPQISFSWRQKCCSLRGRHSNWNELAELLCHGNSSASAWKKSSKALKRKKKHLQYEYDEKNREGEKFRSLFVDRHECFRDTPTRERRSIGKSKSWVKCFWGRLKYLNIRVFFWLDWGYSVSFLIHVAWSSPL